MTHGLRILVADDNADVLLAVADLIQEQAGVDIVSLTTTVEDTVRSASWHKPDVAFVDAFLAGGGAMAVARRIRKVSGRTCVVALASVTHAGLAERLRAEGAACYEKENLSAVLPTILGLAARR